MNKQEIIDNAPEGATHWDIEYGFYWRMDKHSSQAFSPSANKFEEEKLSSDFLRSLADIKRIVELEKLLKLIKKDLLMRAEEDEDGIKVVDLSSSIWIKIKEALKEPKL